MKTRKKLLSLMTAVVLLVTTLAQSVLAAAPEVPEETAATSWMVNIQETDNGLMSLQDNKTSYLAGETVTLLSQPGEGYETDAVTVTGDTTGATVDTTADGETYTFQMPEESVQVTASYKVVEQDDKELTVQADPVVQEPQTNVSDTENSSNVENVNNLLGLNVSDIPAVFGKDSTKVETERIGVVEGALLPRSTVGSLCTISYGASHSYGSWFTREFTVTSETGIYTGYCVQPNSPAPSGTYQVSKLDNNLIKALLMIAPGNPYFDPYGKIIYNEADNNMYAYAHAALSYAYEGSLTGLSPNMQAGIRNMIMYGNAIVNGSWAPDVHAALNQYEVYIAYNEVQDIVWLERNPEGYVKLTKASADPTMTNGNSCYSLEGAVYGVYSDSGCTNKVGELRTDASGNTNTLTLDAATYYVKEIQAPKGYALDRNTYPVTIQPGQTATVSVQDRPQNDPVNMLLGKYDGEKTYNGEANLPQGSATLAGAEFEVKFYGGMYDTLEELAGQEAIRSWTFRTNANGFAYFGADYLVSGDDFYRDSSGNVTLPLGTVTIQETKAPEGYNLNDEIFIRQISPSGDAEDVRTYNMPEIPEDVIRGDLEIIKVYQPDDPKEDTLQGIEGVEFTITSKTTGEEVMKIVTDEEGKATTKSDEYPRGSLVYDTYIITETKTPEGYNPIKPFEVTIKDEMVTLTGIYKQDTLITSPIQVVKVDESTGKVIPAAGTTFQLLDENKNVIEVTTHYPSEETLDRFTTDENGQFVFPEMLRYGTYYLRELQAPEGYLLNGEDLQFTVTDEAGWDNPLVIKFANENAMGQIEVTKTDEETGDVLAGAEFEITAAEDIVTPDGTVRAEKGNVVGTIVTDESGYGISDPLYLGHYELKETKAPERYVLSKDAISVELKYKDQITPVVYAQLDITNKPTEIIINKTQLGSDKPLNGVTFKVWYKDDVDQGMVMPMEYTTDADGQIRITHLLRGLTYCIQESSTLPGYILDETVYEVTIDDEGYIDGEDTGVVDIENDYTKLYISKQDMGGKELPGAEMKLEKVEEDGSKTLIREWTSTDTPEYFEALEPGQYVLTETLAPKGYEIAEAIPFEVKNTGEVQSVTMKDELKEGRIRTSTPDNFRSGSGTAARTGDTSDLLLYMALILGAAGVVAVTLLVKIARTEVVAKKKENTDEQA